VAFEGLLNNGEHFARRLLDGFSDQRDWPQLAHIATDGETYGHHHAHGDMALAYALDYIESNGLAKVTNYAEYLRNTRRCTKSKSSRIQPGAAYTAWGVGARTVAAIRAGIRTGIRNGVGRCARRWIGYAMKLHLIMNGLQAGI